MIPYNFVEYTTAALAFCTVNGPGTDGIMAQ